jgi:hypothetical protein
MLKKNIPLDINAIGKFNYSGNISITENLILTKGNLRTAIGSLTTDVKIKYPGEKKMSFELGGSISNFEIGQLLKIDSLEKLSATYLVRSDAKGIGYDATLSSIGFNGYIYKDLIAKGVYAKNRLETSLDINDENLMAKLQAVVDFNDSIPRTLAEAEVFFSDLQKINLTALPLQFNGKAEIDLVGNDPDNLNGVANFSNLTVYRNNQAYKFDTLTFKAATTEHFRSLAVLGKDIDASIEGQFTFEELPATLNQYFYSYYPLYFTKMAPPTEEFDLTFKLELKNSTAFTKILDNGISGLSYSKIEGKINTKEKLFKLDASIPKLEYNNFSTYDFELHANGDADSLLITSKTSAVVFNDSLSFPKNEIEIRSSKNISFLNINTFSEQSDYGARLQGYVENIEEGIKVHFNPSTLVFNEKTWNIEKDGEVLISRKRFESTNFRLTNGEQSIALMMNER